MKYLIIWTLPYEGGQTETVSSLEEVKTFIKKRNMSSLEDFQIFEISKEIDVYELMRED